MINRAAKALVAFEGRTEVKVDDIERVIPSCLNHRWGGGGRGSAAARRPELGPQPRTAFPSVAEQIYGRTSLQIPHPHPYALLTAPLLAAVPLGCARTPWTRSTVAPR